MRLVGLHHRRTQHDHGGREVSGAGLPAAWAATVGAPLLRATFHGQAVVSHHGSKGIAEDASDGTAQCPSKGTTNVFRVLAHECRVRLPAAARATAAEAAAAKSATATEAAAAAKSACAAAKVAIGATRAA